MIQYEFTYTCGFQIEHEKNLIYVNTFLNTHKKLNLWVMIQNNTIPLLDNQLPYLPIINISTAIEFSVLFIKRN